MTVAITVTAPDGRRTPIQRTPLAPLADTIMTVALGGEDALATWFEPVHRPPVEDVEIDAKTGNVTLFVFTAPGG